MAFLRSDESENYWSGKGLACLMLGNAGYGHEHRDKLHIDLHGKGRLFYNDYMTMQYEQFLHSFGRPYPTEPAAYRPTVEMQPYYWWIDNERGRTTDATWSLDFVQSTAGITPGLGWGEEWFKTKVSLRATMTGARGTTVSYGDGPLTNCPPYGMMDGNPEPSMPVLVARRQGNNASYCVVHEPFEMPAPTIGRVTEIARTQQAAGLRVDGRNFSDRAMVALMPEAEGAAPQVLSDGAEFFAFHQYGYLRLAGNRVVARGGLSAFRVQAPAGAERELTLNLPAGSRRAAPAWPAIRFVHDGRHPGGARLIGRRPRPDPALGAGVLLLLAGEEEPVRSHFRAGTTFQLSLYAGVHRLRDAAGGRQGLRVPPRSLRDPAPG
jgi:hypothetical protein